MILYGGMFSRDYLPLAPGSVGSSGFFLVVRSEVVPTWWEIGSLVDNWEHFSIYLRTFGLLVGPELGDQESLTYPGILWRGFLGLSGRRAKDSRNQAKEFGRNPFSRSTRGYSA